MNFCQFWNAINGEMYVDVPPPVNYKMADYNGAYGNTESGNSELKPLSQEDMCRYAADDVVAHYNVIHKGKNPKRLGNQMTDSQFKKFMGQTW